MFFLGLRVINIISQFLLATIAHFGLFQRSVKILIKVNKGAAHRGAFRWT